MNNCFLFHTHEKCIPIIPVKTTEYASWLAKQQEPTRTWLKSNDYKAKSGAVSIVPDKDGNLDRVIVGVDNADDFWVFAKLANVLPANNYKILASTWDIEQLQRASVAWGIGSYKFTKYKKPESNGSKLVVVEGCDRKYIESVIETNYWLNDLINSPNADLGPEELAAAAQDLAKKHKAKFSQIVGEKLLKERCAGIYSVGKGSTREPRLVEINWSKKKNAPKITLVGKGVCFDSGGYDLKISGAMENMQKDMAGAAHVLGLAKMIMDAELPVNLRVLIPIVENLVSANSYRAGDIFTARNGKTVEVLNTDAEGRLILADALSIACEDKPDLLLDFASLTGAIHIALGVEMTGMFTDDDGLAAGILDATEREQEPLWRMPLYKPYREYLKSKIADIKNISSSRYGGAITASLFLKEFVTPKISWAHFDLANSNGASRENRPKSGEVFCLRGVFDYLRTKYV